MSDQAATSAEISEAVRIPTAGKVPFQIFRADSGTVVDDTTVHIYGATPSSDEGMARILEAGLIEGQDVRQLFDAPGFSLVRAWFKHGYPLPRHSHNTDCLYYVIGGELKLGNQTLRSGDGVFVPAGAPYTFSAGVDGAEFLEFRHCSKYDMRIFDTAKSYWDQAEAAIASSRETWKNAVPPTRMKEQPSTV